MTVKISAHAITPPRIDVRVSVWRLIAPRFLAAAERSVTAGKSSGIFFKLFKSMVLDSEDHGHRDTTRSVLDF